MQAYSSTSVDEKLYRFALLCRSSDIVRSLTLGLWLMITSGLWAIGGGSGFISYAVAYCAKTPRATRLPAISGGRLAIFWLGPGRPRGRFGSGVLQPSRGR